VTTRDGLVRDLAREAASKPGFERVDADWLAARLVGAMAQWSLGESDI
jgi:hypothetical protein